MKELCIRCGKQTPYDINTSITVRRYFVEGAGQLCEACFHILYPVPGSIWNNDSSINGDLKESKKEWGCRIMMMRQSSYKRKKSGPVANVIKLSIVLKAF